MIPLVDFITIVKGAMLALFVLFALAVISTLSPRGWSAQRRGRRKSGDSGDAGAAAAGEPALEDVEKPRDGPDSIDHRSAGAAIAAERAPESGHDASARPRPRGHNSTAALWGKGVLLVAVSTILMPVMLVSFYAAFSSFGTAALLFVIFLMFVLEFAPLGKAARWFMVALPVAAAAVWALSTGKATAAAALLVSAAGMTVVLAVWTRSKGDFVRRKRGKPRLTSKTLDALGSPDAGFAPGGTDRIMKHARDARGPDMYFRQPK